MIKIGEYNDLRVARLVDFGLYLESEDGFNVLLPLKYIEGEPAVGDMMRVFVYIDSEGRPIATTERPFVTVGHFAYLQVVDVNRVGAFLDWGLQKNLLCPFREQKVEMKRGGIYLVYVYLDAASKRVVATAKIEKYVGNKYPDLAEGTEVDALVIQHTELGYKAIVNDLYWGMLYENELHSELELETTIKAWVKNVRSDGKVDLLDAPHKATLDRITEIAEQVLRFLRDVGGRAAMNDKSSPEQIKDTFSCSKKDFKKALGFLLKNRQIDITDDGIVLRK